MSDSSIIDHFGNLNIIEEEELPEIEYNVLVDNLNWKRSFPNNTPGHFKFPLTIPREITSNFSVGVEAFFTLPGWFNILDNEFIQIWTTENGDDLEYLGNVQVPPGRYKNLGKLTRAINHQMDLFCYENGLPIMPQFVAKVQDRDWKFELWPAHFPKYSYDISTRSSKIKKYIICCKIPLHICRMLGLHARYSQPRSQWDKNEIYSSEYCNPIGNYNKLRLMSNLCDEPLFEFYASVDSHRLDANEIKYHQISNIEFIEYLEFWFETPFGQRVGKTQGDLGFKLKFKEVK